MRMYRALNLIKLTALTAFAMAAGAGCCYRIMANPELYIMPVERFSYEIGTLPAKIGTLTAENGTLPAENGTVPAGNEPHKASDMCRSGMVLLPDEPVTASGKLTGKVAPEQHTHTYDIPLSDELQHTVMELADRYGLCYELILAVIMTESSGRSDMTGDEGDAVGLMQIQPKWYGELISETGLNVDEPIENVELGIIILLGFLKENDGSIDRALKQYNSGNPDYEGNEYIERVHEWLDYFEKEAAE